MKRFKFFLFSLGLFALQNEAKAGTLLYPNDHAEIISERKYGDSAYIYVEQGFSTMVGKFATKTPAVDESGEAITSSVKSKWKGYGVVNGLGVEYYNFLRLGINHTLVNMRSSTNGFETLNGSKLGANIKFIFTAPVANIGGSFGLTSSKLDYRSQNFIGNYLASGSYKSVSIERFIHKHISVSLEAKTSTERYEKSTVGDEPASAGDMKANSKSLDFTVVLWF